MTWPAHYVERVNRAIDFIVQNCDQPIRLERIADVAGFSPFHFHRIFRSILGESTSEFAKRLKLERAIRMLSQNQWAATRPRSLTEIAFACGFQSSSDFSRCFKLKYGVSPRNFDVNGFRSRQRRAWHQATSEANGRHLLVGLKPGNNPDGFAARIRDVGPRKVAYVRVSNSFEDGAVPNAAFRMIEWAEKEGLADGQWLGYMWDDPEVVPHEKCRYDVGLVVPHVKAESEIGQLAFPAMTVAEIEICGPIELEMRAFDWLFGTWLPNSGYEPTNHPCFEAWRGRPYAKGLEHFELTIQLPITRCR